MSCPLHLTQKECSKLQYITPFSPMDSKAALISSSRSSLSNAEPTSELISWAAVWSSNCVQVLMISVFLLLNSSIFWTISLFGTVFLWGSSLIYVSLNFCITQTYSIYFSQLYKNIICNILTELVQTLIPNFLGDSLSLIAINIDQPKLGFFLG